MVQNSGVKGAASQRVFVNAKAILDFSGVKPRESARKLVAAQFVTGKTEPPRTLKGSSMQIDQLRLFPETSADAMGDIVNGKVAYFRQITDRGGDDLM